MKGCRPRPIDHRDYLHQQRTDEIVGYLRALGRSDDEIRRVLDGEIVDLDDALVAVERCA